jgi:hypothetical protein
MRKSLNLKKLALSLASGLLVAGTSAGLVFAWSSAQGKVSGIGVTVGSAGLLVNGVQEWSANVSFNNILPGWTSAPIAMTVKNVSQGMNLSLSSRILFTGSNFTSLANTMLMAVEEVGSTNPPDFQNLNWWSVNGKILSGGPLASGATRDYQVLFKLPTTASDEIQGKEVGLSVLLTGIQAP